MSSSFGRVFTLTTYGESHGAGIGGVVDGCPPGLKLDEAVIQRELDRRRPGSAGIAGTSRCESDAVRLLSGVFGGVTTGTPIAFHIANENQRSGDYAGLAEIWRPGHADMGYDIKYGLRDYRGGGRSSGRETAARVAGGAIAQVLLAARGISVSACAVELGGVSASEYGAPEPFGAEERPYAAICEEVIPVWERLTAETRSAGDTLGGVVRVEARGVPAGLGEPVFDKLDAVLAHAVMSVGAVKSVEIGSGREAARMRGSEHNDPYLPPEEDGLPPRMASNHAGGILGGISTGAPIILHCAVKPIPSISLPQKSVKRHGEAVEFRVGGRHDICAIPRVVPVLKAMTALTIADMLLRQCRMHVVPGGTA